MTKNNSHNKELINSIKSLAEEIISSKENLGNKCYEIFKVCSQYFELNSNNEAYLFFTGIDSQLDDMGFIPDSNTQFPDQKWRELKKSEADSWLIELYDQIQSNCHKILAIIE